MYESPAQLHHIKKAVPSKLVSRVAPHKPWMTSQIETAIKEKHAAFRKFKRNPSSANQQSFKSSRNRVTSLLRKAECAYLNTLYRNSTGSNAASSDSFWQYRNCLVCKAYHHPIPDLHHPTEQVVFTTPSEKATALNRFLLHKLICQVVIQPLTAASSLSILRNLQPSRLPQQRLKRFFFLYP